MKIQDLLQKNQVVLDIKVTDKTDLICQLGKFLSLCHDLKNPDSIIQSILERESDLSTGIGYGIGIPHCRLDGLDHSRMVAARCAEDIEFSAIDDLPVRLIFMLVSPSNTTEHAELLLALSRILSIESTRTALLSATSAEKFLETIAAAENNPQ